MFSMTLVQGLPCVGGLIPSTKDMMYDRYCHRGALPSLICRANRHCMNKFGFRSYSYEFKAHEPRAKLEFVKPEPD